MSSRKKLDCSSKSILDDYHLLSAQKYCGDARKQPEYALIWAVSREEESRKEHLVDTLDTYLKQNSTRLSRNPTFEPYYGALTRSRTPGPKRDSSVGHALSSENDVTSVVRGRGRRSTKVKEEHEEYVCLQFANAYK